MNSDYTITSDIQKRLILTDLSHYALFNIDNYSTITEIPQEHIEYLSSGLAASSCYSMFMYCRQLTSIPWNEFNIDTSQCTDMYAMFSSCQSITSLNLTGIDTSKVTNMAKMFNNCQSLQEIICPDGFDLSSITTYALQSMFEGCNSYSGEPLHFKNVPQDLDFSRIYGKEGKHYVIDSYLN